MENNPSRNGAGNQESGADPSVNLRLLGSDVQNGNAFGMPPSGEQAELANYLSIPNFSFHILLAFSLRFVLFVTAGLQVDRIVKVQADLKRRSQCGVLMLLSYVYPFCVHHSHFKYACPRQGTKGVGGSELSV